MILFHGSNQEIKKPRLIEQTRGLDFGAGFDMEVAEKTLSVRRFADADSEWLNFVSANRLETYDGNLYDVVVGAVANDTVMPTMQAFLGGFLTEEAAIATLKASKLADQITLKTAQALSLASFVRSYHGGKGGEKNG